MTYDCPAWKFKQPHEAMWREQPFHSYDREHGQTFQVPPRWFVCKWCMAKMEVPE